MCIRDRDYTFGGYGCYFNGGKVEKVRWLKGAPDQVLRIVDADGNEENVKINPGKTYLAVVDLDEAERFTYNPAIRGEEAASSANS